MPIEVGIWKLGETPERISFLKMPNEEKLENIIAADISILDQNLLLVEDSGSDLEIGNKGLQEC